jgi:hypothetical protein
MSTTMTHKRIVSAFTKAGFTVSKAKGWDGKESTRSWTAVNPKNKRIVGWTTQAAFVPSKDGKDSFFDESTPITTYIVEASPHTDVQTDCFCDSFYHTIKEAVRALAR